jgi:hypothetical protein
VILRDTIDLHASPADVFAFFEGMDQPRYLGWHPDHKVFRWTRGKGLKVGNEFYFEEVIAGKLLRKSVVFTRIDDGERIEFAPTFWLMRLFLPRLVFRLEPIAGGHYRFVAEIVLRAGPLAARLNKREFDAVREHMRVEGINLKRFVEERHEHARARAGA